MREPWRDVVGDLRRPRYAALAALMVVIAAVCCIAGTWQIARYDDKHLANDELRTNARDAVVPVGDVLPVAGSGPAPTPDAVEFRAVSATGRYDVTHQTLVRRAEVNGANGFLVVTPLQTAAATVLVVRGFVQGDATMNSADAPPPPDGTVTVRGRAQPGDTGDDHYESLGSGQVDTVDVAAAARRLGTSVYAGSVQLDAGQPGSQGLAALPAPDLNNPAGGAFEWQHLAYIIQWYLFAGLALVAPLVMIRADRKRADDDRAWREDFTRQRLAAATAAAALTGPDASAADATVVRVSTDDPAQTAERLAERYGR